MIRQELIERILRNVYGEQPTDDSNITNNLVNSWMSDAIGIAAKQNYKEAIQIDGVSYVNNSFYTTFKGLAISKSFEPFVYVLTLPQLPLGIGKNEGVASLRFTNSTNDISYDGLPLSTNQVGYANMLKVVPNKITYWSEGTFIYAKTTIPLCTYTGVVRMISGGDKTDLNSVLNVPDDYINIIIEYCTKMLKAERATPKDNINDGSAN